MYFEDISFIQPPDDENIRIWRYMSFTKLVSLLESGCLFFSRADRLGDPFEGSWPKPNILKRDAFLKGMLGDKEPPATENWIKEAMWWPKCTAVNCWHMNEYESDAMWKLYMQGNEGTAVQSTFKKLKDSLNGEEKIHLGVVKYIDYETASIYQWSELSPLVHKRKSFEHERELRAIISKVTPARENPDFTKGTISDGIKIKVNMGILIENIYVAPSSPVWFKNLVQSVVVKYGYSFEIKHSRLDEPPLF